MASSRIKKVELLTNGTLLDEEMSRNLLEAGLTMLWISIDSLEPEGYEKIRVNSKLEKIITNIKIFNRLREYNGESFKSKNGVKLGIAFVAMKSNINQLEKMPLFCAIHGINKVNVSNLLPSDEKSLDDILYSRALRVDTSSESVFNILPEINIPIMDWNVESVGKSMNELLKSQVSSLSICNNKISRKSNYCKFIEEGCSFIKYNGNISPCMGVLHSSETYLFDEKRKVYHHYFGNVLNDSLEDVWNKEEYSIFREKVRKFNFPPCIICGGCENWKENKEDCFGNLKPTCGACLWSEGIITCP
ncbi:SPASM domain-containing protein [Terrisporobacter sp.]